MPSAPKGNQIAAKKKKRSLEDSFIRLRVTSARKAAIVEAANKKKMGISEYILEAVQYRMAKDSGVIGSGDFQKAMRGQPFSAPKRADRL